jgi:hypothetical protein
MGTLELKKRLFDLAGSNIILSMPHAPCPIPKIDLSFELFMVEYRSTQALIAAVKL